MIDETCKKAVFNFIDYLDNTLKERNLKTEEVEIDMNKKKITIELPEPPSAGSYSGGPSGDTEYNEAIDKWYKKVNAMIVDAIPHGYKLSSSDISEVKTVRHLAEIVVEKK